MNEGALTAFFGGSTIRPAIAAPVSRNPLRERTREGLAFIAKPSSPRKEGFSFSVHSPQSRELASEPFPIRISIVVGGLYVQNARATRSQRPLESRDDLPGGFRT